MHRIASREQTMPVSVLNTPWASRVPTSRGRPVRRRKLIASEKPMKPTWILAAAAPLILIAACARNKTESDGAIFVSGRIDGDTVDISSKIQGRIVDLKVREGDTVEAGQIVAW